MVTNRRSPAFLGGFGRRGALALGGLLAFAACSSGGGGGSGTGGSGTAGSAGGTTGSAGTTGSGGSAGTTAGSAGTTGAGGNAGTTAGSAGTTGSGGSAGATAGSAGTTGVGGSAGASGRGGTGGAVGSGGSGGTAGAGGSAAGRGGAGGSGGTAGSGTGGRGGSGGSGGSGGGGGATGTGGAGGTNCAGHAVSFNANVAGTNDPAMARVNVPSSTDLPTGNASRTIEFWAYVLSTSWAMDANTMFFYGTNNRNNDGFGFDFGITSGGIGTIDPFTNNSTTDPMGDNKASGLQANMNQWAHFAMTWDGTSIHAYVNGVEKVTVAVPAMLHTGTTALTIGGYQPNYFNGYIDEFRIWNVAHTATEIQATMNKTLIGNETGLVGYWKFDETSGTTAADSVTTAGHMHPGTLMANSTANLPTWVVSAAPLSCP